MLHVHLQNVAPASRGKGSAQVSPLGRRGDIPGRLCSAGSGRCVPVLGLFPAATVMPTLPRCGGEERGRKAPSRTSIPPSAHPSQAHLQPPQPSGPGSGSPAAPGPAGRVLVLPGGRGRGRAGEGSGGPGRGRSRAWGAGQGREKSRWTGAGLGRAGPGRGLRAGQRRLFSPAARRGGPGLSEGLTDLKFWRLNERNTQLTKQCATEEVSSGLAKSLLSFHLFSPNNSCPLIPCYSAVKNKTSL